MRLLCSIKSVRQGRQLHELLRREGIDNELELTTDTDWGSEQYGENACNLWIIEEDQFDAAAKWYQIFEDNPDDPRLIQHPSTFIESMPEPSEERLTPSKSQPLGFITLYLIILCTIFFLWEMLAEEQTNPSAPPSQTSQGYVFNDVWRQMLIEDPVTNHWNGLYDKVVDHLKGRNPSAPWIDQPLFTDIRNGEVWRLFSPALLHSDIFHLFFNMAALLVLGRQMESRLRWLRYIIFILFTGVVANIAQYLVSGPNFIGFSGVLVAMITFIVARQQIAPWEGYQLQRPALVFIAFFLFAMIGIQFVSFLGELFWNTPLAPRIANTAHVAGGVVGYALGRTQLFAWKR